jgi:GNAT superfamily N-acetyltransferase
MWQPGRGAPVTLPAIAEMGGRGAPFSLRPGGPDDLPFVFATWLRSYKRSSSFARRVPNDVFYKFHHQAIERILVRTSAQLRIAHAPDAPGVILGYAVTEPGVVHFVYVKGDFRRFGIGSALLAHVDVNACVFTHWTEGWDLLLKRWPQAQYNPYLI